MSSFHSCWNGIFSFHSCWNGVSISFLQEWYAQAIPFGMECSFHSCRNEILSFHSCWNGIISFHSCWNGVSISFLPEWNAHSIPAGMKYFHSIPTGIKCNHSIPTGMKYTFHSCSHSRKLKRCAFMNLYSGPLCCSTHPGQ